MTSISSVGSYSQPLLLSRAQQNGLDPDNDGDVHSGRGAQRFKSDFTAAAKAAGADPAKIDSIFSQVQQAAQDAIKNTTDPTQRRQAVQQAIAKVLTQNGVDPSKFEQAIRAASRSGRAHHHRPASNDPATSSQGDSQASNITSGTLGTHIDTAA